MALGVLRTWKCKGRCGKTFSHGKMNPTCPTCGSIKTQWIPGGFNIGNSAKNVDKIVKDLAASYGMTDIPTAKAGEAVLRAKQRAKVTNNGPIHVASANAKDWKQTVLAETAKNGGQNPGPITFNANAKLRGGGTAVLAKPDRAILRKHTTVVHKESGLK